jgi:hypothetical protein
LHGTRVNPAIKVSHPYPESPPELRGSKLTGGDRSINGRIGKPSHSDDVGYRNEIGKRTHRRIVTLGLHMLLTHSWL